MARDVVDRCGKAVQALARSAYGPDVRVPDVRISGHLDATFPYILSHLEYIVGERLRNSVQAGIEQDERRKASRSSGGGGGKSKPLPPIEVTICEAQQHVIIRVSDQGGGIPRDIMPYLWSFSKGPHSQRLMEP